MNFKTFTILLVLTFAGIISSRLLSQGTVETVKYYSTTQSDTCLMNIYFPPGYEDPGDTNHYPVFYLMHGGGENYTYWVNYGLADTVLDAYIPAGIAVPMILVMPDGKNIAAEIYSNEFRNDIIPFVESNYRVIADKDHRGIGGLSWGGQQSLVTGILHYDMFGYLSILSSGYFSQASYDTAAALVATDAAEIEKSIRYFYFAEGTSSDLAYESGMIALNLFRSNGITVHYWEFAGGHQWTAWKNDFKTFTKYIFRDTTHRFISLAFQGGKIKNSTVMTWRDSLAPEPATPERPGWTFAGWYRQPEYIDSFNFATDTIRTNITLYADWTRNYYKVAFNTNGGSPVPDTIITTYDARITEPVDPEKTGFEFGGWYANEELTEEWNFILSRVLRDTTLYAKWNAPSDLSQRQQQSVYIYPNPAQSQLHIANLPAAASITIMSTEGRLLMEEEAINNEGTVNIQGLPRGVYLVTIKVSSENYHFRLVKD